MINGMQPDEYGITQLIKNSLFGQKVAGEIGEERETGGVIPLRSAPTPKTVQITHFIPN